MAPGLRGSLRVFPPVCKKTLDLTAHMSASDSGRTWRPPRKLVRKSLANAGFKTETCSRSGGNRPKADLERAAQQAGFMHTRRNPTRRPSRDTTNSQRARQSPALRCQLMAISGLPIRATRRPLCEAKRTRRSPSASDPCRTWLVAMQRPPRRDMRLRSESAALVRGAVRYQRDAARVSAYFTQEVTRLTVLCLPRLEFSDSNAQAFEFVCRRHHHDCRLLPALIGEIATAIAQFGHEFGACWRHCVDHDRNTDGHLFHTTAAMSCSHRGARRPSRRPAK